MAKLFLSPANRCKPCRQMIFLYPQQRLKIKPGMNEKAKRHGHIKGWVKTAVNGNYSIYTIKPAPYFKENMPAHIHTSIKEPNIGNGYYLHEFVFDNDKLLTSKKKALENRGSSGILSVSLLGNLQVAKHNIILGLPFQIIRQINKS